MLIINLITGALLAGLGLFIGKHPEYISGYSTMPEEKKKNVEIDKIAELGKRVYVWLGALIIVCSVGLYFAELDRYFGALLLLFIFIGTIFFFNAAQKYDRNSNKRSKIIAVNIFVVVLVTVCILAQLM